MRIADMYPESFTLRLFMKLMPRHAKYPQCEAPLDDDGNEWFGFVAAVLSASGAGNTSPPEEEDVTERIAVTGGASLLLLLNTLNRGSIS
jgi:hypothetical protein